MLGPEIGREESRQYVTHSKTLVVTLSNTTVVRKNVSYADIELLGRDSYKGLGRTRIFES
jgi:hypothetical protein